MVWLDSKPTFREWVHLRTISFLPSDYFISSPGKECLSSWISSGRHAFNQWHLDRTPLIFIRTVLFLFRTLHHRLFTSSKTPMSPRMARQHKIVNGMTSSGGAGSSVLFWATFFGFLLTARIVLMVCSIACSVRHLQLSLNRMSHENHHSVNMHLT